MYWLVAAIIGYHILAFIAYASADAARWYVSLSSTDWEEDEDNYQKYKSETLARSKLTQEDRDFMEEQEQRLGSLWRSDASSTYGRRACH